MGETTEILLNSYQNVHSVNVDMYQKIELSNKPALIIEYDIENILSATEVFDAEREANDVYRIYGRIEYLSLLNGLRNDYEYLEDFFLPQPSGNSKNIFNSFKFYLLKAGSGYTQIISGTSIFYVRKFEVIATPNQIEIYNAGYTNNLYGDQIYAFNFNVDFHVGTYVDDFGFPATELFLYPLYQPKLNGNGTPEAMSGTSWNPVNGSITQVPFTPTNLNIGDSVYGDLIEYAKTIFFQNELMSQEYYITTPYTNSNNDNLRLKWKYNPFIPFRLKYFNDSINRANTGTTTYEQQISIPYYATSLGNGNYVWKDILPQGFTDPITNLGVDYPFVNHRRYLFSTTIIDVSPDLNDSETSSVFAEIKFGAPTILNTSPLTDLNNIAKPCQ